VRNSPGLFIRFLIAKVAEFLKLHLKTVHKLAREGKLPGKHVGNICDLVEGRLSNRWGRRRDRVNAGGAIAGPFLLQDRTRKFCSTFLHPQPLKLAKNQALRTP
jgi:hypothetical protein